jgi:signal transduction histidine kinase
MVALSPSTPPRSEARPKRRSLSPRRSWSPRTTPSVSPIRDAEGKIVGASSIARRITYRRKAAAAHEINNPLAVIMGYAELLADKVDARGREQIDEILGALSQIQKIVGRMKRVTRIELTDEAPHLPEMLDLKRSSEPGLLLHSQPPGVASMTSDRR